MESTSGMVNLGKEYGLPAMLDAPSATAGSEEKRVDYPTLYISGVNVELPDDEFYFVAKGKKVAYRKPIDGEPSCEIAVMSMKVKGLAEDHKEEEEEDAGLRLLAAMLKYKGKK